MERKRVVITGIGAVTPLGNDVATFWQQLTAGVSGVGHITRFDTDGFACRIGAEVKDFDPAVRIDRKEAKRMDRYTQFFLWAALEALEQAGLTTGLARRDRAGVILGSGIGGMETMDAQYRVLFNRGPDRISPFFIPMMIANMGAAHASMYLGLTGPSQTVVTACASSNDAIGTALRVIQRGEADVIVTGGAEAAFVPIAVAGFSAMKALSTWNDRPKEASRPFDAERNGFVMGEGAGCLILESLEHAQARGATILAELAGYGATSDAHHFTEPHPEGAGAVGAMQRAIRDAGLEPEAVDYINAHGTSTPKGDIAETVAIKQLFGDHARRLLISSTKSMTGHLLGGTGAIELIACVEAIRTGVVPPTINYEFPDPECDLDYVPNEARQANVNVALSNSFGFGGQNSTLLVKRWSDA